jgi:hypothetical protein
MPPGDGTRLELLVIPWPVSLDDQILEPLGRPVAARVAPTGRCVEGRR